MEPNSTVAKYQYIILADHCYGNEGVFGKMSNLKKVHGLKKFKKKESYEKEADATFSWNKMVGTP